MEELKRLYDKLQEMEDPKEREVLWLEILEKNRILLQERLKELDAITKNRADKLQELTEKLKELTSLRDKLKNNFSDTDQ